MNDIYSTPVVPWAFLAQVLCDGKGASCHAAVTDIANFMIQTGVNRRFAVDATAGRHARPAG